MLHQWKRGLTLVALLGLVAVTAQPAVGQTPPPPPAGPAAAPAQVGQSTHRDVSPPLRSIPVLPEPAREAIEEVNERLETGHLAPQPPQTDPVRQTTTGSPMGAPTALGFPGGGNLDGVYPPDPNGDVGPDHYVQWVNLHFQIWDKAGNSLYGPAPGNALWQGFGGPCEAHNDGDPIVLYDSMADRWVMSQFVASNPYGECVAVSTGPDPTGAYYRYFFQFSTSVLYDYPHLGVWPDGYYLGANRFQCFLVCQYRGPSAIVFNRSQMLTGQAATYQEFTVSSSYGTLLPADLDGPNVPPAGSPGVFAELGTGALHLWKLRVNWSSPSASSLIGPTTLAVAAYNRLCGGTRSCVPQPGTSVGLDGIGDRLLHRLAYRNLGDHDALVVSHAVNAATNGTQAGVRWYEIRNPTGSPLLYQQGTFAPNDGLHRWLSSIAMDKDGNLALGYSVSSASVYPGLRYTGRLASDPLGQMTRCETTIIDGAGAQTGTASRWGDYAAMSVDPGDDATFWFTSEYMPSTGPAPWKTQIVSFHLGDCVVGSPSPTPTPTPTSTPSGAASATPTVTASATLTVAPTATATSTPSAITVPSAPANLTANRPTGQRSGVDLAWNPPASNGGAAVTSYRVYRSTDRNAPFNTNPPLVSLNGATLSYNDTGAVGGTTYYYWVTAVNSVGESSPSNQASARAR